MYEKMNNCEPKINCGMPSLCFFVRKFKQGNSAFNDPEKQQATNKNDHPFYGPLFQCLKMSTILCHILKIIYGKSYEGISRKVDYAAASVRFVEIHVYNQSNDLLYQSSSQNLREKKW